MRSIIASWALGASFLLLAAGCSPSDDNVAIVSDESAGTSIEEKGIETSGGAGATDVVDHHSGQAAGGMGGSSPAPATNQP